MSAKQIKRSAKEADRRAKEGYRAIRSGNVPHVTAVVKDGQILGLLIDRGLYDRFAEKSALAGIDINGAELQDFQVMTY